MMATCGKCGYDGPFNHGCGPSPASVSLVPRVNDLEAENARLQDELKATKWTLEMDDPRLLKAVQTITRLVKERDRYKALAERRKKALALFDLCQDVQHKPAEYVTRDMAMDAGEPTMEGTMLRGAISEPCGNCDGCRARAATEEAHVKLHAMFNAEDICKECGKPKDCVCHREHLKAVIIDEAREGQAT